MLGTVDGVPDPLIELVRKKERENASPNETVAAILRQLADEVPEHYGPGAQVAYRHWLIVRSQLAMNEVRYVPPVLAQSW